ncbi:integrase [Nocardia asteroides]|uniref:integrase n=1 Tax=Nocardia asteroides TaxID=1824 RepID=UPI0033C2490C
MQLARELLDESVAPGIPERAVQDLRAYAVHALKTDPGLGRQRETLGRAAGAIKQGITTSSHAYVQLSEHVQRMEAAYLSNWADEFESGRAIEVEGAARRISAHILDAGYHKNSLYTWLGALSKSSDTTSAADFLREAADRLSKPERSFTFCVPITNKIPFEITHETPGWMSSTDTSAWKKEHAPSADAIRHQGSFLLEVQARDVNYAADRARTRIADLEAKFQMGSRSPMEIASQMWSKDKGKIFAARAVDRTLEVRSFERLEQLHDLELPDYMTSALALLQPLRSAAAHLAIMSGWSAIESLLVGPDDSDIDAAERFSLIVAASMPRAEMTRLAYEYIKNNDDPLAEELREAPDNLTRARRFQQRLCDGTPLTMKEEVDNLAITRLQPFLTDPAAEIRKITAILTKEFVRFYRKRNLIVHGGKTHSDSLHPLSATMSPLIGAGVDRFVTAGLKFGVRPIALSAIALANLDYLRPPSATDPGNLLDLLEVSR